MKKARSARAWRARGLIARGFFAPGAALTFAAVAGPGADYCIGSDGMAMAPTPRP